MKEVTRYQCPYCKKDFRTPDKHYCKFNPILRNCFTCKHLKGWSEGEQYGQEEGWFREPNTPDCDAIEEGLHWDIEHIKERAYNMQCKKWEEGKYEYAWGE